MSPRKAYAEAAKPDAPNPLDWQKKVLDHTHVYAIDGPSTCVFLDKRGKKQKDHTQYAACIPIELFAPENEEQLRVALEHSSLLASAKKRIDIDALREEIADSRPRRHAFIKTEKEELQIKKLFVELCKFPTVVRELYNKRPDTQCTTEDLIFLIGRDGANLSTINESFKRKKGNYGYFNPEDNVVAISAKMYAPKGKMRNEVMSLRLIVSEEILHALDFKGKLDRDQYLSAEMPLEFTKDLEAHSKKLLDLLLRWNDEIESKGHPEFTDEEQKFKQTLVLFTKSMIKADTENNHPCMQINHPVMNDPTHRALYSLEDVVTHLNDTAKVMETYKKQLKETDVVGFQIELFAKLAKNMLLTRYRNQFADPKLFGAFEKTVHSPYGDERDKTDNPFKKLIDLFEKMDSEYRKKYDAPARKQGQLYAEKIAQEVEDAVPGSTGFIFTDGVCQSR